MSSDNPSAGGEPPRKGFIASIMSVPSAIFDRGTEHGRQWRDRYESREEGKKQWGCTRHQRSESSQAQQAPSAPPPQFDSGRPNVDEWFNEVHKELEKREQIAKELYDSWGTLDRRAMVPSFDTNGSEATPPRPESKMSDVEKAFDRMWGWPKRDGIPSPDTLFEQLFELTSNLENEIPQKLAHAGFGFPFMGKKLNPVLNDSINSGYSPLQLEQQEGFDNSWRVRFEDLVRATNAQSMLSNDEADKVKRQTWSKWLIEFQTRNQISTEQTSTNSCPMPRHRHAMSTDAAEPHVIVGQGKELWQNKGQWQTKDGAEPKKPWFQMSTAWESRNSQTNADGSVTTKIHSGKRLPDGTVEQSERSETTPAQNSLEFPTQQRRPSEGSKKSGWFWS